MILTCPACATQYTVKDGAIPPGGRKVRCASCKHSWHQDGDDPSPSAALPETGIAPPPPEPDDAEPPIAEVPEAEASEAMFAGEPQPEIPEMAEVPEMAEMPEMAQQPAQAEQWPIEGEPVDDGEAYQGPADEHPPYEPKNFASIPAMHDEDEAPRRGRAIGWIVGLVLLVVAAAAAFWFLAPAEYKARAGIAGTGETPLELMLTTSDRQKLASGNELLAISGRIINPTDEEQVVPPINAELRNKQTKQLVYSWTIAPPARSLPPRGSASFNSAEVDIPEGGDELTVTLGGQAG